MAQIIVCSHTIKVSLTEDYLRYKQNVIGHARHTEASSSQRE